MRTHIKIDDENDDDDDDDDDGDDFSVRALIPQFSCASSNPLIIRLIGTNLMVVNIIIITVVVRIVVKFEEKKQSIDFYQRLFPKHAKHIL